MGVRALHRKCSFSKYPIQVIDKGRGELDEKHGSQAVSKSNDVSSGPVNVIKRDKTLLDIIIITGSPSQPWKILCSMVDETSVIAHDSSQSTFLKQKLW